MTLAKLHSQKKFVNRESKIIIHFALAIEVTYFFEVKRKKKI